MGPFNATTQMASQLAQPFLHSSPQNVPVLYAVMPLPQTDRPTDRPHYLVREQCRLNGNLVSPFTAFESVLMFFLASYIVHLALYQYPPRPHVCS